MSIEEEMDSLREDFCSTCVGFDAILDPGIYIQSYGPVKLYVPEGLRGQGHGSRFLGNFVSILDKHQYGAALVASEEYGMNLEDLVELYENFGFEKDGDNEIIDSKGFRAWRMLRDVWQED